MGEGKGVDMGALSGLNDFDSDSFPMSTISSLKKSNSILPSLLIFVAPKCCGKYFFTVFGSILGSPNGLNWCQNAKNTMSKNNMIFPSILCWVGGGFSEVF